MGPVRHRDAATGWEELCRHALGDTRRCLQTLQTRPTAATGRTGCAATWPRTGTTAGTWTVGYEVTSGGPVRYLIDDQARTVWLVYASSCHPKETD